VLLTDSFISRDLHVFVIVMIGIVMYMPASYSENVYKIYNVLVMHDGQNLFDPSTSAFGTAWYDMI
jgi:predicted alpha/beta superfamily hydrolase